MTIRRMAAIAAGLTLSSCSATEGGEGEPVTLYRNSPIDPSIRVHWASFNSSNGGDYNLDNCGMAARLLNANMDASSAEEGKERDPALGFWCEPGEYSEEGPVPGSFNSAFPTDAP